MSLTVPALAWCYEVRELCEIVMTNIQPRRWAFEQLKLSVSSSTSLTIGFIKLDEFLTCFEATSLQVFTRKTYKAMLYRGKWLMRALFGSCGYSATSTGTACACALESHTGDIEAKVMSYLKGKSVHDAFRQAVEG